MSFFMHAKHWVLEWVLEKHDGMMYKDTNISFTVLWMLGGSHSANSPILNIEVGGGGERKLYCSHRSRSFKIDM